jgi:hypothetical protein
MLSCNKQAVCFLPPAYNNMSTKLVLSIVLCLWMQTLNCFKQNDYFTASIKDSLGTFFLLTVFE